MKWITIVILTYNEEKNIENCLADIKNLEGIEDAEIIVADGNSTDKTRALLDKEIRVIITKPNKSIQMNEAHSIATGEVIWYLHADMKLDKKALGKVKAAILDGFDGGGFSNVFDQYNDKIKRLGRIFNFRIFDKREQSDKGIFYGDNGIFLKREVLKKVGGVPKQAIMEDYELSRRLNEHGAKMIKIKDTPIIVSARRHIEEGFIKTRLQWVIIRKLYQWGMSPAYLKKLYHDKRK